MVTVLAARTAKLVSVPRRGAVAAMALSGAKARADPTMSAASRLSNLESRTRAERNWVPVHCRVILISDLLEPGTSHGLIS